MKTGQVFGIALLTLMSAGTAQAATDLASGCYQHVGLDHGDGKIVPPFSRWAGTECSVFKGGAVLAPNDPDKSLTFRGSHYSHDGDEYFTGNSDTTLSFWPQTFGPAELLSSEESMFFPAVVYRHDELDALTITATKAKAFSVSSIGYRIATGEWWDTTWIDPWMVSGSTPNPFEGLDPYSEEYRNDAEKWAEYYAWFDYYTGPLFQMSGYRNNIMVGYSIINASGTEQTGSLAIGDIFKDIDKLVISYLGPNRLMMDDGLPYYLADRMKPDTVFCQFMCTAALVLDSMDYSISGADAPSAVPLPASAPLLAGVLAMGGILGRRTQRVLPKG